MRPVRRLLAILLLAFPALTASVSADPTYLHWISVNLYCEGASGAYVAYFMPAYESYTSKWTDSDGLTSSTNHYCGYSTGCDEYEYFTTFTGSYIIKHEVTWRWTAEEQETTPWPYYYYYGCW